MVRSLYLVNDFLLLALGTEYIFFGYSSMVSLRKSRVQIRGCIDAIRLTYISCSSSAVIGGFTHSSPFVFQFSLAKKEYFPEENI